MALLHTSLMFKNNFSSEYLGEEMINLLRMTEFFLNKNFFTIHNLKFPECRVSLAEIVKEM